MVLFGQNPSQGTLLRASQFLLGQSLCSCERFTSAIVSHLHSHFAEELPVRLAHRIKELDQLPHELNAMPSINKVKDWYAQSFEVCTSSPARARSRLINHNTLGTHILPSDHLASARSSSINGLHIRSSLSPRVYTKPLPTLLH